MVSYAKDSEGACLTMITGALMCHFQLKTIVSYFPKKKKENQEKRKCASQLTVLNTTYEATTESNWYILLSYSW